MLQSWMREKQWRLVPSPIGSTRPVDRGIDSQVRYAICADGRWPDDSLAAIRVYATVRQGVQDMVGRGQAEGIYLGVESQDCGVVVSAH